MPQLSTDEIPELLARLVDKSLVQVDAEGRYDLLQLVRQFSQEELARTDEGAPTRTRHLRNYADLADKRGPEMFGPKISEVQQILTTENENIRQAVEWAITTPDTWPRAAQIVENTFWSLFNRGSITEGLALCSLIIQSAPVDADPAIFANVFSLLGTYQQLCDHPDTVATCDHAIELGRKAPSDWAVASGSFQKAMYLQRKETREEVQPLLKQALQSIRKVDGVFARSNEFSILTILGNSAVMDERFEDATKYYEGSIAICDQLNYKRGYAVVYGNLGHLSERLGEYKAAHEYAIKTLSTFVELSDWRNLAGSIADTASGFWVAGDCESAAHSVGCAYGMWEKTEIVPDAIDAETANRWLNRLKEKMDLEAFNEAFEKGKTIPAKEMVAKLLANPQPWVTPEK